MASKIKVRDNFSIYKNYLKDTGHPLVYLDSASTSLTPDCVVEAMSQYYTHYRSNIERSSFGLSIKAGSQVNKVRRQVADFISAPDDTSVLFTSGATDAANRVIDMLIKKVGDGESFLTSVLEHHSVYVTLEEKCKKTNTPLIYSPVLSDGTLDYEAIEINIKKNNVKVIFTQLASNVTGQVNKLVKIREIAEKHDCIVVCDGSQAVGHISVSVVDLGVDVLFFSGHKMFGPTGVGVLYVKNDLLNKLTPSVFGGGAVVKVRGSEIIYQEGIKGFEPGTANIAGIIGLGRAVSFIDEISLQEISVKVDDLLEYTLEQFSKITNISVYSTKENVGIVSFSIQGIHAHDIEYLLGEAGMAVRAGYHCAESFTRHISEVPLTRVSLHVYNSKEDIDILTSEIKNY